MEPFDIDKNLIAALGLQALPEDRRIALLEAATELVQKRVMIRLMEALPDEDAAEAEKLAGDPERLLAFLSAKVPDVSAVIAEETENVRRELLAGASGDDDAV